MPSFKTGLYGIALAVGGIFIAGMTSADPPLVPPESPTSLIPPWFAFNIGTRLHDIFSYLAFVTQPPDAYIIDLTTAYWNSEVAYALNKNKILDAVEKETATGGTVSCETVADKLDLNSFIVCRYMESGAYLHLLDKDASTKEFSITPHGSLLTDTGELRDFNLIINQPIRDAWRAITTDLMKIKESENAKGKSGFSIATGGDWWSAIAKDPELGVLFNGAMNSLSKTPTGTVLLDWNPPAEDITFCDIGGGNGSFTAQILSHYPKMSGIVFDTIDYDANTHMKASGVADRANFVRGDFFEDLPLELMDCDVFYMRYIIHDFDDESNVRILKNIRTIAEQSPKDGKKVVLVQGFVTETGTRTFFERAKSLMSINMIANNPYGSCERTLQDHADLFAAAGIKNFPSLIPLRHIHSLVEVEV